MKRISGPASAGRPSRLAQLLLTALLTAAAWSAGRRSAHSEAAGPRPSPAAAAAAGGAAGSAASGGGGATAAATVAAADRPTRPDLWRLVDVEYDATKARAVHASTPPPKRRPGFVKPATAPNQDLYDALWGEGLQTVGAGGQAAQEAYGRSSCWGCRLVPGVVARLAFDTVLDAGTGNGMVVRVMRGRGKAAWGVELSGAVLERQAGDLLKAGLVEQGSLTDLPYEDSQFDLVFSADVLEHLRPDQADAVVRELVRVSRRHIVLSISLKSWQNARLHTLLRPRAWWEALFARHGAAPNRPLVWALQDKDTRFSHAHRNLRNCTKDGDAGDGGLYEVCVVDTTWLVGWPGQEVRRERCITPANAELEPWIFAFTVDKDGGTAGGATSGAGEQGSPGADAAAARPAAEQQQQQRRRRRRRLQEAQQPQDGRREDAGGGLPAAAPG